MPIPKRYLLARKAVEGQQKKTRKVEIRNEGGTTRVNIYGDIGPWGVNAQDFATEFGAWDIEGDTVNVHINSPGGEVFDGLAIYHTLKHSTARVVVHVDGLAASAASFIAMAGDKVLVGRNSRIMIHDAHSMPYGNADDLREVADWLDEESDNIADIYAQKAGGTAAQWRETMKGEQWYSSSQAIEAGLADAVEGDDGEEDDGEPPSVAASLFKKAPGGPAQPVTSKITDPTGTDDEQVYNAFKEAWS